MCWVKSLRVLRWNATSSSVYDAVVDCDSPDYFLGLGMQYVIVEVVVRVVPARRFDAVERMVPTDELTASLDTFNKNYEFWRVNWMSSIEQCLLWTVSPAQDASADKHYSDTATDSMKYLSKLLHFG